VGRRCREALAAAICELVELPFTGSDALTLAATQDKAVARRLVSPEVPVARAALVASDVDERVIAALPHPVIVKPNDEGSSKGIGVGSVCATPVAAAERCRWLQERYRCPVLVEEFLAGPEVTVGVRGNGPEAEVLGLMEVAPAQPDGFFIYDLEAKRDWRRRIRYHIPPRLPSTVVEQIRGDALCAYHLLGCCDIARLDFRLNTQGRPHFLECNPLPGLNPSSGDIVLMSKGVLPYEELVQGIFLDAVARLGKDQRWHQDSRGTQASRPKARSAAS
jgi:D-alanine-D-alanine ligase